VSQITAIECYGTYQAIKRHFEGSYDYVKYNGKVNINPGQFESRKDYLVYNWLAKKYNKEDYTDLVLANILKKGSVYSRDLLTDQAKEVMLEYQKRIGSLNYIFKNDLLKLIEDDNFTDIILSQDGDFPKLLKRYEWKEISLETVIIIDDLLRIFGQWNKSIDDRIIWPSLYKTFMKYKPFLQYDREKIREIFKEVMK
jgi:hypothetical protein